MRVTTTVYMTVEMIVKAMMIMKNIEDASVNVRGTVVVIEN